MIEGERMGELERYISAAVFFNRAGYVVYWILFIYISIPYGWNGRTLSILSVICVKCLAFDHDIEMWKRRKHTHVGLSNLLINKNDFRFDFSFVWKTCEKQF